MSINNESELDFNNKVIGGNITDKALLYYSGKYMGKYTIIKQDYFSSTKKYSSVTIDDGETHELFKGAPEKLLPLMKEYYNEYGVRSLLDKNFINKIITKYTSLGYRVILLGDKQNKYSDYLIFVGLVLLKDEVQETAKETVE